MDNKYYTPTIDELHIGYKYERYSHLDSCWKSEILDYATFITILDGERCDFCEHNIRVKYLDKSDLESLGFNFVKNGITISNANPEHFNYKMELESSLWGIIKIDYYNWFTWLSENPGDITEYRLIKYIEKIN